VNGSAAWNPGATLSAAGVSGTPAVQQITWVNGGGAILAAGQTYGVNFVCEPQ
jgi:hypothetical protein